MSVNINPDDGASTFPEDDLSYLSHKSSEEKTCDKLSALSHTKGQSTSKAESADKGFCLILSFQTYSEELQSQGIKIRDGNEKDVERLCAYFDSLGCDLEVRSGLKSYEIPEILKSDIKEHSHCKYFVCCILTHGNETNLCAYDALVDIDEFLRPFSCHSLDGKPKIFFIQACRGKNFAKSTKVIFSASPESSDGSNIRGFQKYSDFFIVNSSYTDEYSLRNLIKGTYFIQNLCYCLEKFGTSKDLLWITTYVTLQLAVFFERNSVQGVVKQMPHTISTLSTTVFFANQESGNNQPRMCSFSPSENKDHDKETTNIHDGQSSSRLEDSTSQSSIPVVAVDVNSLKYPITKAKNVKLITFYKECEDTSEVDYRKVSKTVCRVFANLGAGLHAENSYKKMKNITNYVKKFSKEDYRNIDCLICFAVIPKEKDYLNLDLCEIFTGDKCRFLVGKPKIFIILTCAHSRSQISTQRESTDGSSVHTIPLHADCLEVQIAVQDLQEMENYTKIFCDMLEQHKNLHILEILTKINFAFQDHSNKKEISKLIWNSTLTRCVYFPKTDE